MMIYKTVLFRHAPCNIINMSPLFLRSQLGLAAAE
jgi:hypothetical protein